MESLVLYPSAKCNLKCEYCFICKNKGLDIVDKELEETYKDPEYCFNMYSKITPKEDYSELRIIELFGGEPLLGIDRILPTLETFIQRCPNLSIINIFTNFTHNNALEATKHLSELLQKYAPRQFEVDFQISIDGPAEITDIQRGENVTRRIIANFNKLCAVDWYASETVKFFIHFKPTISPNNITKFLDEQFLYEYYKFFDDTFYIPLGKLLNREIAPANIRFAGELKPLIAFPWDLSIKEAQDVAQICQSVNKLALENKQKQLYTYVSPINWYFSAQTTWEQLNECNKFCPYTSQAPGLLPGNIYSSCKQAFAAYCEDYVNNFDLTLFTKEQVVSSNVNELFTTNSLEQFEKHKARFITAENALDLNKDAIYQFMIQAILRLAKTNQIDSKYANIEVAREAAIQVEKYGSICAYHDYMDSGHEIFMPVGALKRFLNGLLDTIEEAARLHKEEGVELLCKEH